MEHDWTGEGLSLEVLEAAFGGPGSWLPRLHDRLAILRRLRLSLFRKAAPSELAPEPWTGSLSASIAVVSEVGRSVGRFEVRGGLPGNAAYAVFTRDGVPVTAILTLYATGSAAGTIDVGPASVRANATLLVISLDREGRIIRSVPVPVAR